MNNIVNWRDYVGLCKPRVIALMILTSIVGMCLASTSMVPLKTLILGNLGIALAAASAAAINHLADHRIDKLMRRTQQRPIVTGKVSVKQTLVFAFILCVIAMLILGFTINVLTAVLTFISLVGYAGVYTYYLKHATSQNIVIGGIAGAAPPLLGWVAVTGHITAMPLILVMIIFVWTPPHFWALAINRREDYAKANVPMLPITHGVEYTKKSIVLYTWLLCAVTLLPFAIMQSTWVYALLVSVLNLKFLHWVYRLRYASKEAENQIAMNTFKYSIYYLMILFSILLIDHFGIHFIY